MSDCVSQKNNELENIKENDDIFIQRLAKIKALEETGIAPFGEKFQNREEIRKVRNLYAEEGENEAVFRIAGRMTAMRIMGKSIFADLKDSTAKIQIYVQKKAFDDPEEFNIFKSLNIGDILGVEGKLFKTRKGELSLRTENYKLLSKSMRPLPEKWHGLTDRESRYRQRYLDLIMNDSSKDVFIKRFKIIRKIRSFLEEKGFLEVETPMLQAIPGGAAAKPFKSYYEALDTPMYMRIAPELYLKRLLVGGLEKVYELNRNFRNEGISRRHNPEFTMLEIYEAYGDCRTMMNLVEELVIGIAEEIIGDLKIKHEDIEIDLSKPWKRLEYKNLIKEHAGNDWFDLSRDKKLKKAMEIGVKVDSSTPEYKITNEIYEKIIEPTLIQPTFVTKLPAELVPLAKRCKDDPELVDVFELEINGQEIAPGYTELNDPVDQRLRFEEQLEGKRHEEEEQSLDFDFLTAMEHGMPPAGGMGIGIDRLIMLLTGAASIRDVVLFPQLRPKN